ncbi:nuclear transcription factor Y subunit B-3-like isoform X1 [Arachis stenosperma]|uniref:nuclear transcription factor Y subunit B-3-like isoform X1 n=2 Tax=Arachis stenosperma TaxID=217475 RepID=UPI0025AC4295|nr:nuclear transcription factor Y subunit B-3-like isoform X1 [Arachis stenosperma]
MAESDNESGGQGGNTSEFREQDRFLPIANVSRIMKKALPANAKISKEAKETVQECVSEFISFITGEASDKCQKEKRKTINGDDLLWAMTTLGFEEYVEPLKVYLHKYREMEGERTALIGGGTRQHAGADQTNDGGAGGGGIVPSHMMMMMGHQHQHQYQSHGHMFGSGGATGSASSRRITRMHTDLLLACNFT